MRNAVPLSQPASTNHARNGGSGSLRAGAGRSHNPSAVSSSPTCPTGVSAGQRPATGPTEPSRARAPGSVFVPHREWGVWNPPVVSLTETASIPVRAGQTPDTPASSRPEPSTGKDLVAHSWHSPSGIRRGTTTAVRADGPEDPSQDQNADRSRGYERTNTNSAFYPFRGMTHLRGLRIAPDPDAASIPKRGPSGCRPSAGIAAWQSANYSGWNTAMVLPSGSLNQAERPMPGVVTT